mmetsp:Transcript_14153/g.23727  ORF Transcript_14153/g.23727 Transcript_14153/m.23727 type:complete len:597 (-) Transcript_14153:43-1833(-)
MNSVIGELKLPSFLQERCVVRRNGPVRIDKSASKPNASSSAAFVLYLSTVALRADENPALDVALHMSRRFDVALVVHSFFNDKSAHATSRRAHFVLDSVREYQSTLKSRGIPCTFQMMKPGSRQQWHLTLASRAVAIVTDEPFVHPHLGVFMQLYTCVKNKPLITVDTSCILPARLTKPSDCGRAFRFRKNTEAARKSRLAQAYPHPPDLDPKFRLNGTHGKEILATMPFKHNELENMSTGNLLQDSQVDFNVKPVSNTKGGSRAALARWSGFLRKGLSSYSSKRNNPLLHHSQGVSRMSPYLNLGIISPFRVGRDVAEALKKNSYFKSGPGKFYDEYGTWRELAYAMCYHNPNHLDAKKALPKWAYDTLTKHKNDSRSLLSLEQLCSAQTGVELWDLCQQSLNRNGELHNNLRMTWGKEVVRWTAGPDEAYTALKHLNDHYALDGLSPPSYAGLLWCLGWADGPKSESNIYGKVRTRSARSIAKRYDLAKLRAFIEQVESGHSAKHQGSIIGHFQRGKESETKMSEAARNKPAFFKSPLKRYSPGPEDLGNEQPTHSSKFMKTSSTELSTPRKTPKIVESLMCDGDRFKGTLPPC